MEQSKKEKLEEQLHEYISGVLSIAEREEKLDYMEIIISKHQKKLQMDFTIRDRQETDA